MHFIVCGYVELAVVGYVKLAAGLGEGLAELSNDVYFAHIPYCTSPWSDFFKNRLCLSELYPTT